MLINKKIIITLLIFLSSLAKADSMRVFSQKAWHIASGDNKCYISSFPTNSASSYLDRNAHFMIISPNNKIQGYLIYIVPGIDIKKENQYLIKIGDQTLNLLKEKNKLYVPSMVSNKNIIDSMKKHNQLYFIEKTKDQETIKDTYLLSDFNQALAELHESCIAVLISANFKNE